MSANSSATARGAYWLVFGILVLGAASLFVDRLNVKMVHALHVEKIGEEPMGRGGFVSGGVYPTTGDQGVPSGLETRGSWLQSDLFQGTQSTSWFLARPEVIIMVAGYPSLSPNRLTLEVRYRSGREASIAYHGGNPGEAWRPWIVSLPGDAEAVRVRAVDGISTARGWLAFSIPFRRYRILGTAIPIIKLVIAACLAFTLVYGPGLLWHLSRQRGLGELAIALLVGPLALAVVGVFCWALGGLIAPVISARIAVGALLVGLAFWGFAIRRRLKGAFPKEVSIVVIAGALLSVFAVAKANLSYGPEGELYGGTVSRTLEVGWHSDSRISYHVVQLVAHHLPPYSKQATSYFSPYSFASRGPLAGLLAAPVVLATGAAVSVEKPDQPWEPFDAQGFAVYRITLIALASLAGWAVFGTAATLMEADWALFACITLFLTPFFAHEIFFTWPKMMAATCTLVGFQQICSRRYLGGGLALGVGYLFHPLALLSAPFLALWILVDRTSGKWSGRWRPLLSFSCGLMALVLVWQIFGHLDPANTSPQSGFLSYLFMAEGGPATWQSWLASRWESVLNTFVPFRMWAIASDQPELNSVLGRSDPWVQFGFLYWNTFPFALGILTFLPVMLALLAAVRRWFLVESTVIFGPAILLLVYWGAGSTGLMRYCGHVLFLSSIVFSVWYMSRLGPRWKRLALLVIAHPVYIALRGIDVAWMAFGTTLHRHWPATDDWYCWNDWISLGVAALSLVSLVVLLCLAAKAAAGRIVAFLVM